jgi:ribose-phosphate pyrophosphokinase
MGFQLEMVSNALAYGLFMRVLAILFLNICMSLQAYAQKAVISMRGSEQLTEAYCASVKCDTKFVKTDTKEFDNGNTFVRFTEAVAGQEVVIITPETMTADQFLELLIKIRTAKQEFARSVDVITGSAGTAQVSLKGENTLNEDAVLKMIKTAGADSLNSTPLKKIGLGKKSFAASNLTYVVDTGHHSQLSNDLAEQLSIPVLNTTEAKAYAHKNPHAHAIVVAPPTTPHNVSFLEALNTISELKGQNQKVTFVTPYLPYARSDKKDQRGVGISGRLAADIVEASGVDAVQFVRAHAPQSQGFFSVPTIQTMGRTTINNYLASIGIDQVISPDAGFQKDATLYADELKVPVGVINKQRDLVTGESKLIDISGPSVMGKSVAVIDDETASGSTLKKAAELLKQLGAKKVVAVVTHLAGSADKALTSEYIDTMVVSDTFPVSAHSEKLKVLSISNEIASDLKIMLQITPRCSKVLVK